MKNKHWMIVLLFAALAMTWPGIALAEGGEEDELSGFALFEKLRAMKLEAQSAMVKEDYVEAAKIYRRMARYEKNRARSAAYLLRGADCLMQAKKGHRALEEYTNLLENYPLYVPYEHVVEQLRQLAEWFIVGDGTFLGIKDKDTGIQIYELIIREAPAVQVTLKDRLRLAELLEGSGRGEEAVVVYQAILRQEPGNWDVRAKLALLFLKLSKNGDG
ncbi:MAG: tetratricopeptide repeat protein, partial [Victivallales bacterium]|nr:tetratricopeptide repeat protein [Victivallales bacterium]